jgi:hypothetical protein
MDIICKQCKNIFKIDERFFKNKKNRNGLGSEFCSVSCYGKFKSDNYTKVINCKNCEIEVVKHLSDIRSKSGNSFCSRSCSATYNNKNKKFGTRRSKLEIWIEEKLKNKYNFEIIFNGKEVINSELDIYIPSLKLAFELNGIFHYEAIYGEKKLEQIINNDNRKIQACVERGIECCIIDTSNSKNFKPERDKKYLDIIENIIENKLCRSGEIGSTR